MALTRATGRGDSKVGDDEEFLEQLYRGGELLAAGQVDEAKGFLERAHALQPKNEKGQNLLGLTYFKLGEFQRAAEIYELLVRDNPVDPTLRVNLGLVYLKSNTTARAVREFENAVDLAPEHTKAQNYLGLALAQAGEYGRAREHFLLAGSDAMAEKMSRALTGDTPPPPPSSRAAPPLPPAVPNQRVEVELGIEAPPEAEISFEDGVAEPPPDETSFADVAPSTDSPPPDAAGWSAPMQADELASQSEPPMDLTGADALGDTLPPEPEPSPALAQNDWGAQFGFDAATAPPPEDMFSVPTAVDRPEPRVEAPVIDVALEVAAIEARTEVAPPEPEPLVVLGEPELELIEEPSLRVDRNRIPTPLERPRVEFQTPVPTPPPLPIRLSGLALEAPKTPPVTVHRFAPRPITETTTPAPPVTVEEQALEVRVALPADAAPFTLLDDACLIQVRTEMMTRTENVVAVQGALTFKGEHQRFRGRIAEKTFGEGPRQLARVTGQGTLLVRRGKSHFALFELSDQSVYLRESQVFAFEEAVTFENGRVPSEVAPDLDLVHLSGQGLVLLRLPGALRSVEVQMDAPVLVPLAHWVGWQGNVSPRVLALPFPAATTSAESAACVELSGEGYVLLSLEVEGG